MKRNSPYLEELRRKQHQAELAAADSHGWAVAAVQRRFSEGLERLFDETFVRQRVSAFEMRDDPVYATLLQGMDDVALTQVLVTNWTLAHTMATMSRSWLEDAIVDILLARPHAPGVRRPDVYSLGMLADGWHLNNRKLWDVGARWREDVHGRGAWRPMLQERALDQIELVVAQEERRYEEEVATRRRVSRYDAPAGITEEEDLATLATVAESLGGRATPTLVRCNLLLASPDPQEPLWAIRYINPSTMGQAAQIRTERVNLLRLHAHIVQERPFQAPGRVHVVAADLVPRLEAEDAGRTRAHFSRVTRWRGDQLWQEILHVPFAAVTAGIRGAAASMGVRLRKELRVLLGAEGSNGRQSG